MSRRGIYQIKNAVNGKRYIGSSVHIMRRKAQHKNLLRNNRHPNRHLQNSWNKHGEDRFRFSILGEFDVSESVLRIIETLYLNNVRPEYNNYYIATRSPMHGRIGADHPGYGIPLSEEHRRKIGDAQRGEKNHMWGKTTPESVKEKIRASLPDNSGEKNGQSKLTRKQARRIMLLDLENDADKNRVAREYGVSKATINDLRAGRTWKHLRVWRNG